MRDTIRNTMRKSLERSKCTYILALTRDAGCEPDPPPFDRQVHRKGTIAHVSAPFRGETRHAYYRAGHDGWLELPVSAGGHIGRPPAPSLAPRLVRPSSVSAPNLP